MPPTSILVTGCPRSGTSATAGLLVKLGIPLGANFQPHDGSNPGGYWEDLDWLRIVRSAACWRYGKLQHDYPDPDPNWWDAFRVYWNRRRTEAAAAGHPCWAVKDTLSLILPDVRDCFDRVIVLDRGYAETVAARKKLTGRAEADLHPALRTRFERRAIAYGEHLLLDYKKACRHPSETAGHIAAYLDVPCTTEARTHFDPELRRIRV